MDQCFTVASFKATPRNPEKSVVYVKTIYNTIKCIYKFIYLENLPFLANSWFSVYTKIYVIEF
jgi:hypothetical protein